MWCVGFFFFQAEDGIRDTSVTGSSDVCSSDLGTILPSAIDWMTRCLPRLYTRRLPSGDQLGKPLFTPSSAISRYPEPSGLIKAICADGNPAARKSLPTQKAIMSPAGDQTASNALIPSLW